MLVPVQNFGTKPPLFFVHGLHGLMPLGSMFARMLGPDQPLYAINANGMDGQRPVTDNMRDMTRAYVEQIEAVWPHGAMVIGGMCDGGWAAIELARDLQARGREVRPVILADPPVLARSYARRDLGADHPAQGANSSAGLETARKLKQRAAEAGAKFPPAAEATAALATSALKPDVEQQLYRRVRDQMIMYASRSYNSMPFDVRDADQLHLATVAGLASVLALSRHLPMPYPGPAHVILSAGRRGFGFFHRQMPWPELLPGPHIVHVLPWDHGDLFQEGRDQVARSIKFMLAQGPALQAVAERRTKSEQQARLLPASQAATG